MLKKKKRKKTKICLVVILRSHVAESRKKDVKDWRNGRRRREERSEGNWRKRRAKTWSKKERNVDWRRGEGA